MSEGRNERYILSTPQGEYVLDGSFKPSSLSPTATSPNLVRARGYRQIYDLSDGLPDPVPIVLTGTVEASNEDDLALMLRELRGAVKAATRLTRNDRPGVTVLGGSMLAVPIDEDSNHASVTVTLIPAAVPNEGSGIYDW